MPATSGYPRRPDFFRHLRHQWRPLAGGNNQERELTGVPAPDLLLEKNIFRSGSPPHHPPLKNERFSEAVNDVTHL